MPEPAASGDPDLVLRPARPAGMRLGVWFARHGQSFFFALGHMSRTPGSAILTTLVIAVALAFPAGLYSLLTNSVKVAQTWDSGAELSLFLRADLASDQTQRFVRTLQARPEIADVRLITPEQGLEEFRRHSGMAKEDILLEGFNPLPAVVAAKLRDSVRQESYSIVLQGLKDLTEVEHADFDMVWLDRLRAAIVVLERGLTVLAAVLGLGVLLIVGNTIRVEIDSRRDEIETARLLGATNAFIRRPFLYAGMLIGVAGSLLAWTIVAVSLLFLRQPANELAALYTSQYRLASLSAAEGLTLVAGGVVLGMLGATLAVSRHLRGVSTDE